MKHLQAVLAVVGAATLTAVVWVGVADEEGNALAIPVPAAAADLSATTSAALAAMDPAATEVPEIERAFPPAGADPFAPRNWAPPPAQSRAAPAAPPLPFGYFGRMNDQGEAVVFLQRGDRTYTARRGEQLDPQYRIEDITADAVIIVYLPLKQRQTLHTGSK